jgi:hypothetical protein
MYRIEVDKERVLLLIAKNGIYLGELNEEKRANLLAIAHIFISSNQSSHFNDFVFEMMNEGIAANLGLPNYIMDVISGTNGKVYFDRQCYSLVKLICNIFDNKELARLINCQSKDNKLFMTLKNSLQSDFGVSQMNSTKIAAEICKFSPSELACYRTSRELSGMF